MRFRVELQTSPPGVEAPVIEAADETAALARAEAMGMRVRRLVSLDAGTVAITQPARFPVTLFCEELLSLLEAGLSLPEALHVLTSKERQAAVRAVLAAIQKSLSAGRSFSASISQFPACFPELFLAGVRASETTGTLTTALRRYLDYQQRFDVIRKKLISASIYPMVLLGVGSAVALFLLGYVVPRFSVVFESTGHDIPAASRLMLAMGTWLYGHWQVALCTFLGAMTVLVFLLLQAEVRQYLLERVLALPFLRDQARIFFLSRFYRALSLLLQSGIPLSKALPMARGMLSPAQRTRLDQVSLDVSQGQPFAASLARHGLGTTVADSLLAVGERSGGLEDMLERCARFHDEELGRFVDIASRLLEPVLMTLIGVGVGVIVVLMYMPIFDLAGSIE